MKTVFFSIAATLGIIALSATLFLNSILGVFGLAATSVGALQQLNASQRVVEQLKSRHQHKQLQAAKRLTIRAPRRVVSTALAAATIGTVAVALTLTSLEIADYCEEKQALQDDENLLYGSSIEFDLEQCFVEAEEESKAILIALKNSSVSVVAEAFSGTLTASGVAAEAWWEEIKRWLAN